MSEDTMNSEEIGKAMQAAWSRVKKSEARLWSEWMTIGEGLLEGRNWAMKVAGVNQPEGRGYVTAYAEWLHKYRVDDMDKSVRAKLLNIMEERAAVEEWRATLTVPERRRLNNPDVVYRKWQAATKVTTPKKRSSEIGRATAELTMANERISELEQEVSARAEPLTERIAALTDAEWIALRDAEDARRVLTMAKEIAKPKTRRRRTPDDLRAELDARASS
jgi:hypothetical protein